MIKNTARKMKENFKENFLYWLVFLVYSILLIIYVVVDQTPPHWDSGRHFFNTIRDWDAFKNIFISQKQNGHTDALSQLLFQYGYYPPAVYYTALPFLVLFGRNIDAALLSNLVWVALVIYSWRGITKNLNLNLNAQILGLGLILASPFWLGQMREYQLDFPLFAVIFFGIKTGLDWVTHIDLDSDNTQLSFSKDGQYILKNILFGFALGLGVLVKWSFIYTIVIFFGIFLFGFVQKKFKALQSLPLIFSTAWLVASNWYIPNLSHIKMDLLTNSSQSGINEGDPQGITLASLKFYIQALVQNYFQFWWLLLVAIILLISVIQFKSIVKKILEQKTILVVLIFTILNFIITLLYFLKQSNKDTRYPIVTYISIIMFLVILIQSINFKQLFSRFQFLNEIVINFKFYYLILFISIIYILNIYLPLGNYNLSIKLNKDYTVPVFSNIYYTNLRLNTDSWSLYPILEKAESLGSKYYNDDCATEVFYWQRQPTLKVDFANQDLHTNTGTVWGMAEQYDLTWLDLEKSCFIITDTDKTYPNYYKELEVDKRAVKLTLWSKINNTQSKK
jgi:4-amino-4-deoxy-L-arabinose transferase-like glycosyltransferase